MSVHPYAGGGWYWTAQQKDRPLQADATAREQALGQQLERHLSARIAQIRKALFSPILSTETAEAASSFGESRPSTSGRLDIEA